MRFRLLHVEIPARDYVTINNLNCGSGACQAEPTQTSLAEQISIFLPCTSSEQRAAGSPRPRASVSMCAGGEGQEGNSTSFVYL